MPRDFEHIEIIRLRFTPQFEVPLNHFTRLHNLLFEGPLARQVQEDGQIADFILHSLSLYLTLHFGLSETLPTPTDQLHNAVVKATTRTTQPTLAFPFEGEIESAPIVMSTPFYLSNQPLGLPPIRLRSHALNDTIEFLVRPDLITLDQLFTAGYVIPFET